MILKIDWIAILERYVILGLYVERRPAGTHWEWTWTGWKGNVRGEPCPWYRCWKW